MSNAILANNKNYSYAALVPGVHIKVGKIHRESKWVERKEKKHLKNSS